MRTEVLESLERIVRDDKALVLPPKPMRRVEYQLASAVTECLDGKDWSADKAIERLLGSCRTELPLAITLSRQRNLCKVSAIRMLLAWFVGKVSVSDLRQHDRAGQIIAAYQVDSAFVNQVAQAISDLDLIYEHHNPGELAWMWADRLPQSRALFGRSVFLGLRALWNKDESDEPILWKVSEVLETIAKNGSYLGTAEALAQLIAAGLLGLAEDVRVDALRDFVTQANEDANRNLLDNLVIAERSYRDLTASGWRPDHWELENLPVTVDLYLRFMAQAGVEQTEEIGHRLQITLDEAMAAYRYVGSPFTSPDELKQVVVQAPGWTYRGEMVVRPRVREVAQ
jgi:hypothetical protein